MSDEVLYQTKDGIATITLNRPRYFNAQSWTMLEALDAALDRAVGDSDAKVVVVCGAGKHFSSGHDLGTPEQLADEANRTNVVGRAQGIGFYEMFRKVNLDYTLEWRNLPIPTIARVHGYCIQRRLDDRSIHGCHLCVARREVLSWTVRVFFRSLGHPCA